jgi:glutamyl-tRNA synthetase
MVLPRLEAAVGRSVGGDGKARLLRGMEGLKARAKTLVELAASALVYVRPRPVVLDDKAAAILTPEARRAAGENAKLLRAVEDWRAATLEQLDRRFAEQHSVKLGQLAQPKRAALTGSTTSPPIYEVMEILGKEETLARLRDAGIS